MDWSRFVGLPWEDRGRGPGYDCWGLFGLAFEAGTGVALPSFAERYATAQDHAATDAIVAGGLSDWIPVSDACPFDGVLMRIAGGYHIGLVVRRGLMLHMPRGRSSVIEPIARFPVEGVYRHSRLWEQ